MKTHMPDARGLSLSIARGILGTLSAITSAPLALVMLLPWRDPQGPGAAWAAVGAYAGLGALMVWGIV